MTPYSEQNCHQSTKFVFNTQHRSICFRELEVKSTKFVFKHNLCCVCSGVTNLQNLSSIHNKQFLMKPLNNLSHQSTKFVFNIVRVNRQILMHSKIGIPVFFYNPYEVKTHKSLPKCLILTKFKRNTSMKNL